jgi:hypothetical protein
VQEVISEAGHIVRFVDNQIHRAPNWFIRDTRSGELLKPAKRKEDNFLTSDFLLISILPNILDRESYDRGDKIQIFGGTHGVGTRAVELVCSDNSLIDQINGLAGKLQYWQALLEIDEIDHSKGQSRPVSLGSDICWCEVTFNETELDEWFGRDPLSSNHFHRSDVIKNGRVQLTASRASVYSPMESEGAGVPEREATVEAGPSFPAARGEEKSVGEDSSESIHGDVQSPLMGKVKEHIPGKGGRAMCLEASELTENSEPKEKTQDSQGREKSENPSHWKRSYGSYANSELRALRFDSTEEIDRAIDLIWSDPDLRNLPSDIVDGLTLVVPEDSVEYFRAKALQFTVSKIVDPGELSREKLAQIRMRYGM